MRIFITAVSLASSIGVMVIGLSLQNSSPATCFKEVAWVFIVFGFLLAAFSVLNYEGDARDGFYFGFLLMILMSLVFLIYPSTVQTVTNWKKTHRCLFKHSLCDSISSATNSTMSPVQRGCCVPPPICGFEIKGDFVYENMKYPNASTDCLRWTNSQDTLCYGCETCKVALIEDFRKTWKRCQLVGIVFVLIFAGTNVLGYVLQRRGLNRAHPPPPTSISDGL